MTAIPCPYLFAGISKKIWKNGFREKWHPTQVTAHDTGHRALGRQKGHLEPGQATGVYHGPYLLAGS